MYVQYSTMKQHTRGHQLRRHQACHASAGPTYFGKDKDFPLCSFSVTIARKDADIVKRYWPLFKEFVHTHCEKAAAGKERGHRMNRLHIQALMQLKCSTDSRTVKEIVKQLKRALDVHADDNAVICVKRITN